MTETTTDSSSNEAVYDYHGREPGDADFDNHFVGIAGQASRRSADIPRAQADIQRAPKSSARKFGEKAGAILAAGGLTGLGIAALPEIIDQANGIQYSDSSVEFPVDQGDSFQSFLLEHVKGAETVNILDLEAHVKADPANVNVFPEGKDSSSDIQPGMVIVVPESVDD